MSKVCNFYSAIVMECGKVFSDSSDSHAKILAKNKLNDNRPVHELAFYPVEILPLKIPTTLPNRNLWKFNLGASGGHSDGFVPKWFTDRHKENVWKAFEKAFKFRGWKVKYDTVGSFVGDRAWVKLAGKWGFINRAGKETWD